MKMNANPYKRTYLISEDEYLMRGVAKPADHQVRLNAIALQDERNVHAADKVDVDEDDGHVLVVTKEKDCVAHTAEDDKTKMIVQQLRRHDERNLRVAPKDPTEEEEKEEDEKLRWENVPLDTARWDVLPQNIRTRAQLLITLVHRHAKVNRQQEFQHHTRAVSGSNIFDLVRWAVISVRAKKAKTPTGWSEFVHSLSINKTIPRTILSQHTLDEIEEIEQGRLPGKRAKLVVVKAPFFETLFPKDA